MFFARTTFTFLITSTALIAAKAPLPIAEVKRDTPVDFDREVRPFLSDNCFSCHCQTTSKGGLNLETPELMLKGGDSGAAIGALALSFFISCAALSTALANPAVHLTHNFTWFELGNDTVRLGWLLDPLTAFMCTMVTFVGTLIFIFSLGYMQEDENFKQFFCFLSLFAAAMLGLLVANSLLLLFVCWELVGLASYLLIGFWFHKPSAAAAAKKAFITTRIGDLGFLLGLLWLYDSAGSLLLYDNGHGVLEATALGALGSAATVGGLTVASAIGLLLFCGAVGKSGQFPLHVWLPDAMEGPTPVSALIHAATMVTAGVYLIARTHGLFELAPDVLELVGVIGAVTLVRALLETGQRDAAEAARWLHHGLRAYFVDGIDLGDTAQLRDLASRFGLDADEAEAAGYPVKEVEEHYATREYELLFDLQRRDVGKAHGIVMRAIDKTTTEFYARAASAPLSKAA